MSQRKGGIIFFKIDGVQYQAKGAFTTSLGRPSREAIVGADGVHGYKEMPVAPYVEGEITDDLNISLDALSKVTDATITVEYANGKVFVLRNAWNTNQDGMSVQTEEGNVAIRFEGLSAEEVR